MAKHKEKAQADMTTDNEAAEKAATATKEAADTAVVAKEKDNAGKMEVRSAAAVNGTASIAEAKERNVAKKEAQEDGPDDEMAEAKARASAERRPSKRTSTVATGKAEGLHHVSFPPISEPFDDAEGKFEDTTRKVPDDEMAKAKARASAGRRPSRTSAVASGTAVGLKNSRKAPDDEMAKAKARASAGRRSSRTSAVASGTAVGLKNSRKALDDEMAKAKAIASAGRRSYRTSAVASGTAVGLKNSRKALDDEMAKARASAGRRPSRRASAVSSTTAARLQNAKKTPDDYIAKAKARTSAGRRPSRASAVSSGTAAGLYNAKKTPDDEMAKAKARARRPSRASAVANGIAAGLQNSGAVDDSEGKYEEEIKGLTSNHGKVVAVDTSEQSHDSFEHKLRSSPIADAGELPNHIESRSEASTFKKIPDERPGAYFVRGDGGGQSISIWQSTESLNSSVNEGIIATTSKAVHQQEDNCVIERAPGNLFKAVVVDEESYCRDILMEAVEAGEVVVINDDEEKTKQMKFVLYWICALLAVLGTVIGLSVSLTMAKDQNIQPPSAVPTLAPTFQIASVNPTLVPTGTIIPTLETIQSNGKVRCGFGYFKGIEADWCRALAAAVLGDPEKIDLVKHSLSSRWEALANESLDVVTLPAAHTMARDVYQEDTKVGFAFSTPYFYDGIVFGGIPEYVDCADRLDTYFGNCRKVRICVNMGGSIHDLLSDHLDDLRLHPVEIDDMLEKFIKGECNVLAGNSVAIAESFLRYAGYAGDYKMGKTLLLREPVSMVTREDDKKWSDFVNWVFRSLLAAEEQNITNTTASKFMTTTVFGEKYSDMFVNAIQAVGNYGDVYRRHLKDFVPRGSLKSNLLNNGSTGLHFAHPLGKPTISPDPIAGSTLHSITKKEGKLRCGIFDREGFGKVNVSTTGTRLQETRWKGMDADYCYALSASLFEGDTDKVVFVYHRNPVDGFQALDSGLVDVVAGVPLTLEADVHEESTGKGYTFSMPYFYGGTTGQLVQYNVSEIPEGALSLVTREDDSQWSDFVFWVVSVTFIAEERYITQHMSQEMLDVTVFGPSFVDMHRHAIGAVGNYGEIYLRNVESIAPRQGRNLLNTNPFGPQHWSFFQ